MATEVQLFYIGTSKKKEIRMSGEASFNWGSYSKWKAFKSPVAKSSKKVAYDKKSKNKAGASKYGGVGGVTVLGTAIPATAQKMIGGVERTVDVRYYQRGYTIYKRTSSLKNQKKMLKKVYSKDKPYQFRLQYKDKVTYETAYSEYVDGVDYIYFADHYYDDQGQSVSTTGYMAHPCEVSMSYSDVRKNFESNANNNETRDNKGKYVLTNVRPNVMSMTLKWSGLSAADGADLLDTLNPDGDGKYLIVQYLDPAKRVAVNGTFFADTRNIQKFGNGIYKEITVTLTEV